jgi:hypothetical protein
MSVLQLTPTLLLRARRHQGMRVLFDGSNTPMIYCINFTKLPAHTERFTYWRHGCWSVPSVHSLTFPAERLSAQVWFVHRVVLRFDRLSGNRNLRETIDSDRVIQNTQPIFLECYYNSNKCA